MKTTYIVSGMMRTGTSMMMKCLEAGGLPAAHADERQKLNTTHGDEIYKPNPNGFYELTKQDYRQRGFPRLFEGKLLKCLWGGLTKLCVGNYKIVFMLRNPEEIRQSYEAFYEIVESRLTAPFLNTLKFYDEEVEEALAALENRKDTTYVPLQYRHVVDNPIAAFTTLKEHGWPIDVEAAAAVVDPSLCRFRIENLEVGI